MKHRSRFDRMQRLLKRSRRQVADVNGLSDRACQERLTQRGEEAEKLYRQGRRLISDITKELKR